MELHQLIHVVRLRYDTHIEERVQADEEMLATYIEVHYAEAELHIGERKAVGQYTVSHHAAHRVAATQSLVIHALDEQSVHVVVHVERTASGYIVLYTQPVSEGDAVDAVLILKARHVMAESEVELQVVVAGSSLLTIGGIERSRVGEEQVGIDATVRSLTLVARVEGDTSAQVRMPAAFHLIGAYQSPGLVFVVQSLYTRIKRFVRITLLSRVKLFLAVQHLDVTIVDDISQYAQTGVPFQVFVYRALYVARYADKISFVLVKHTRLIFFRILHLLRLLVPCAPRRLVVRLIAVKSVEVAHSVRQVGGIQRQAMPGDKVLRIVVEAEDAMVLGGVGCLEIQRVDIFGVLAAVAVIVHVGQHTALKTIIGVISYRRQYAEVPTSLDLSAQRIHLLRLGLLFGKNSQWHQYC